MKIFLTPGRVKSFIGVPGPGGYKIYLTDGESGWVEFGGGGRTGNPHGLPRQNARGLASETEAWDFVRNLIRAHPDVGRNPLNYHTLYRYAPSGEVFFQRSVLLVHFLNGAA